MKTGRGGIRDIEYTVQFLQLLNGGDLPAVRQRNTLLALEALEIAGCLSSQETYILADAYRFLRKTEHRLQLLFDLQTHRLPVAAEELRKLALRMGYLRKESGVWNQEPGESAVPVDFRDSKHRSNPDRSEAVAARRIRPPAPLDTRDLLVDPLDQFLKDLRDKTALDRTILNHLLHQTFADEDSRNAGEPEADLILDPDPDEATVQAVLGRYPFRDRAQAFANLSQLARESVPFLSTRRCRHFLASIAPQLLRAVAETPDPDEALTQLERVSASLGAKAVLWELFSFNPPSLKLYVDLCAGSPFLSGSAHQQPRHDRRAARQPRAEPAANGRGTARRTRRTLPRGERPGPDPAQLPGQGIPAHRRRRPARQGGRARHDRGALRRGRHACSNQVARIGRTGGAGDVSANRNALQMARLHVCRYALLGLGKLGGREISYHSDLDLLLVYEAEGTTTRGEPNSLFFTELASGSSSTSSRMGPMGRLYAVDMRLRPTGKSGSLVLPLAEFRRYFDGPAVPIVGTAVARPGACRSRRRGVRERSDDRGSRQPCSARRGVRNSSMRFARCARNWKRPPGREA